MDEGRNVILLFPELIDFGFNENREEHRKLFEPRSVGVSRHVVFPHASMDLKCFLAFIL